MNIIFSIPKIVPLNSNSIILISLLSVLIYMGYSSKIEIRRLNLNFERAITLFEGYKEFNYMSDKIFENTIKENTDAVIHATETMRAAATYTKSLMDKDTP